MYKVNTINNVTLQAVEELIIKRLRDLEEELGIKFEFRGGKFTNKSADLKLSLTLINEDGIAETEEVSNWKNLCTRWGFEVDDLGKEFTLQGKTYKITGLKPRRHRYPISADRLDGKGFKFPAYVVLGAICRRNSDST